MNADEPGGARKPMSDQAARLHLVQLLLPTYDNDGKAFPQSHYEDVRAELTEKFGGLTAYTRAPAQGIWAEEGDSPKRDDIVVYEVMAEGLDRDWWRSFRAKLEHRFQQEELVIRAHVVERL